ncbi:PQQ-binding-like beta-propeller repeat protein [Rosistilla oblonga]|uniref:PQQ-binding-like beta-propeller repeat protein n=1 Tax=Rosistilla oblonga TaxID=2527990 RepID=UPI003A97EC82
MKICFSKTNQCSGFLAGGRRVPRLLLASLLWVPLCLVDAAADDWPAWRGPHRDGVSHESLPAEKLAADGLQVRWRGEVGTGFSSFVVADGNALTIGNSESVDTLFCFDAESGELNWRYSYNAPLDDRDFEGGPTSTPTVHEGRVYVLARQGDLFCLDLATGKVVWQKQIVDATDIRIPGWGFGGSPQVFGDRLLLTVGEAGVAVDLADGKLVWQSGDKEAGYASPVIFDWQGKTQAMFPSGRSFSAVDVATGETIWQQRWLTSFGCNAADPIVHDGHVFLCSGYNRGCALLRLTDDKPEIVWKHKQMQNQMNGCVRIGDALYGVDGDLEAEPTLKCIDWTSGEVHWADDSIRPGAIAATREHLILLTTEGALLIGNASTTGFKPLTELKVLDGKCWTVPVLANGSFYCRTASGSVVCVALK